MGVVGVVVIIIVIVVVVIIIFVIVVVVVVALMFSDTHLACSHDRICLVPKDCLPSLADKCSFALI